ncbi:MAG: hypothetical protein ABW133_09360 [Polyangiaceae bacterium]
MTRLPLWKVRASLTKWVLGVGFFPIAIGCVDPRADYDEFLARPVTQKDAGNVDVQTSPCQELLSQDLNAQYFAKCFVAAVQAPFLLAVEQTVRPSADGMTGELDMSFTALKTTATSLNDTAGMKTVLKTVPVDSECRYRQDAGSLVLPPEANTTGRDVETNDVVFRGRLLSAERSCSELDGKVVAPLMLSLDADGDVCAYVRMPADGSLPNITNSDFVCDPSLLLPR